MTFPPYKEILFLISQNIYHAYVVQSAPLKILLKTIQKKKLSNSESKITEEGRRKSKWQKPSMSHAGRRRKHQLQAYRNALLTLHDKNLTLASFNSIMRLHESCKCKLRTKDNIGLMSNSMPSPECYQDGTSSHFWLASLLFICADLILFYF